MGTSAEAWAFEHVCRQVLPLSGGEGTTEEGLSANPGQLVGGLLLMGSLHIQETEKDLMISSTDSAGWRMKKEAGRAHKRMKTARQKDVPHSTLQRVHFVEWWQLWYSEA